MVQWIGPFVIGIYVGILIDPWVRAWIAENEQAWQRQALEDDEFSEHPSAQVSWSDYDWLADQPVDSQADVGQSEDSS